MKNIGEEVIKLTNEALVKHDQKSLDEAKVKVLKSLIVDLSSKNLHENSVYKLLCKSLSRCPALDSFKPDPNSP